MRTTVAWTLDRGSFARCGGDGTFQIQHGGVRDATVVQTGDFPQALRENRMLRVIRRKPNGTHYGPAPQRFLLPPETTLGYQRPAREAGVDHATLVLENRNVRLTITLALPRSRVSHVLPGELSDPNKPTALERTYGVFLVQIRSVKRLKAGRCPSRKTEELSNRCDDVLRRMEGFFGPS